MSPSVPAEVTARRAESSVRLEPFQASEATSVSGNADVTVRVSPALPPLM